MNSCEGKNELFGQDNMDSHISFYLVLTQKNMFK
jgi:hypothetical protein